VGRVKCREIKREKKRFACEGERGEEDEESAIFEEQEWAYLILQQYEWAGEILHHTSSNDHKPASFKNPSTASFLAIKHSTTASL
jgi:hypothetical protein